MFRITIKYSRVILLFLKMDFCLYSLYRSIKKMMDNLDRSFLSLILMLSLEILISNNRFRIKILQILKAMIKIILIKIKVIDFKQM
jgi:hypothetical protein